MLRRPPSSTPFPYTTLFRSVDGHLVTASFELAEKVSQAELAAALTGFRGLPQERGLPSAPRQPIHLLPGIDRPQPRRDARSEEHTSELQSRQYLVCRLLLEK